MCFQFEKKVISQFLVIFVYVYLAIFGHQLAILVYLNTQADAWTDIFVSTSVQDLHCIIKTNDICFSIPSISKFENNFELPILQEFFIHSNIIEIM